MHLFGLVHLELVVHARASTYDRISCGNGRARASFHARTFSGNIHAHDSEIIRARASVYLFVRVRASAIICARASENYYTRGVCYVHLFIILSNKNACCAHAHVPQ